MISPPFRSVGGWREGGKRGERRENDVAGNGANEDHLVLRECSMPWSVGACARGIGCVKLKCFHVPYTSVSVGPRESGLLSPPVQARCVPLG